VPISVSGEIPGDVQDELTDLGVFFGGANEQTIHVFETTSESDPPTLENEQQLDSGQAILAGVSGNGAVFCTSCDFMKWGAWFAYLDVNNGENSDHQPIPNTQITAIGWWVAADSLPTIGDLPLQGTASYDGHTIGQVAYNTGENGWQNFLAKGDVHMDWDFGQRAGLLEISNFKDPGDYLPVLNASGRMDMPGVATDLNKFSGPLLGTLGTGYCAPTVNGGAFGSFAANGADKTAGVIGNWGAGNEDYKAAGVFGAGRIAPVDPEGHLDNLPPPPTVIGGIFSHGPN
jgi:hypothetical protein